MNKKGMTIELAIGIGVASFAAVILFFIFFGPEEGLGPTIAEWAPQTEVPGADDKTLKEIEVSEETNEAYDILVDIFERADDDQKECIITHPDIPDFEGSEIVFSSVEGGTFIYLMDKYGRIAKKTTIDLKPCIVGGGDAAKNFYTKYFKKEQIEDNSEFTIINEATLTDKDTLKIGETEYDLEDEGCCGKSKINFMYKATKDNLCFFTTFDDGNSCGRWDYKKAGLNDDCIWLNPLFGEDFSPILQKVKACK
ncbi:hypothetical protein ACFLZ7_03085 [Nanoarchaeota archaeon]